MGRDDGVVGEIWTFEEKDPSAIEKSIERKDVITTGCGESPIKPAPAEP
jgi:hypothetical protein